jgi:transcriptional regulator with XRE-family HTH domain
MNSTPKDLGGRIIAARLMQGYAQGALAAKANISAPYLNAIEKNKRTPHLPILVKIADALDLELDQLLGRGGARTLGSRSMNYERMLHATQLAYRKHAMGDANIGWEELGDRLLDALCYVMGEQEFLQWRKEIERGTNWPR